MVATFDVERFVLRTTVEDIFVAAHILADGVQSLDHSQSQTFALKLFGDGDLFHVSNKSSVVDTGRPFMSFPRPSDNSVGGAYGRGGVSTGKEGGG